MAELKNRKASAPSSYRELLESLCSAVGFVPSPDNGPSLDKPALRKRVAEFCAAAGFVPKVTEAKVLRRAALKVDEVIDVGVHHGTPYLYEAFAECEFVLVDPQVQGEALLHDKPAKYKYVNMALGARNGKLMFGEAASRSSFLQWSERTRATVQRKYEVDVTTLDELIAKELHSDRIGIKIDAEGFEGEIIKGLNAAVGRIQFLIIEVSFQQRMIDAPTFTDIVCQLREKGFAFYAMLESFSAAPPRYGDVLFLRQDDSRFVKS